MTLAPRAIVVHRHTELDELLARHGTRGHAAFFLGTRGRRIEEVEARHAAAHDALGAVASALPPDWRRGRVERADLPRFLFAPDDIVIVVGQDGLVANVAKYLDGQPVVGVNPEPDRNPGVLVPLAPGSARDVLGMAGGRGLDHRIEARSMVEAVSDDGQQLVALNEIFVGHPSHQTARYTLALADGHSERQASSGVITSTGTGATGWSRSVWQQRGSNLALPGPTDERLAWFVREAWPSPATGTNLVEGELRSDQLTITVESDRLVAFGDGVEADTLSLTWGQSIDIRVAERKLRLVR